MVNNLDDTAILLFFFGASILISGMILEFDPIGETMVSIAIKSAGFTIFLSSIMLTVIEEYINKDMIP